MIVDTIKVGIVKVLLRRKKIKVKPSEGQSTTGFFVGLLICLIGLFVVIPSAGVFWVFLTIIAIVITVMHGKNAFTVEGISTHKILLKFMKDSAEVIRYEDRVYIS